MSHTPAHQFISQLEAYVDARVEKGALALKRMPAAVRTVEEEAMELACESLRIDLVATLTSLMRNAKRPGI